MWEALHWRISIWQRMDSAPDAWGGRGRLRESVDWATPRPCEIATWQAEGRGGHAWESSRDADSRHAKRGYISVAEQPVPMRSFGEICCGRAIDAQGKFLRKKEESGAEI